MDALFEQWLDPMTMKDLRQGLRTRSFALLAQLTLLFCLATYVTMLLQPDSSYYSVGRQVLYISLGCVMFVTWLVIPAALSMEVQKEAADGIMELAAVAGMSPWRMALGMFVGSAVRVTLTTAVFSPFIVATIVLGDVPIPEVLGELAIIYGSAMMVVACSVCTAGALAYAGATSPMVRGLGAIFLPMLAFYVGTQWLDENNSNIALQWWMVPTGAVAVGALITFVLRSGADLLAPPAARTFFRSKLFFPPALGLFGLWFWAIVGPFTTDDAPGVVLVCLFFGTIAVATWASLRVGFDPRLAQNAPAWMPDRPLEGVLYAAVAIVAPLALFTDWAANDDRIFWTVVAWGCYAALYTGLATLSESIVDRRGRFFLTYWISLSVLTTVCFVVAAAASELENFGFELPYLVIFFPGVDRFPIQKGEQAWLLLPLALGLAAHMVATRRFNAFSQT